MATSALDAMRDPRRAISQLLVSQNGACSAGKDAQLHQATVGAHVTNDRVESNFGCIDVLMRMFRYSTVENVSGVAQQMRNQDFARPSTVVSDRRKRKNSEQSEEPERAGFFHQGLSSELQQSLVEFARHSAEGAREQGRIALKTHDEEKLKRREERVISMLNAAIDQYAYAMELFGAWAQPGGLRALSRQMVQAALKDSNGRPRPEAQQLQYLRHQIEMRVLGLGWTQYATRWSSKADERIGTVAHLEELLEEIILHEKEMQRLNRLPTEASPPQSTMRNLGQLGSTDVDAKAVATRALFSLEELRAKAEAARQRRVEAGIADDVESLQPHSPPAFNQDLVGKRLEILWKYHLQDSHEHQLIWATGIVKRVADGLTDKRSARARKILPAGALLWAWDADADFEESAGEQWLILLPDKWNRQVHYGWRYDPRER